MKTITGMIWLLFLSGMLCQPIRAQETKTVLVKGDSFTPLYGTGENKKVQVADFYMDITPVTNEQFLDFVKKKANGGGLR